MSEKVSSRPSGDTRRTVRIGSPSLVQPISIISAAWPASATALIAIVGIVDEFNRRERIHSTARRPERHTAVRQPDSVRHGVGSAGRYRTSHGQLCLIGDGWNRGIGQR